MSRRQRNRSVFNDRPVYLYELYDPENGIPRYVGITNKPSSRLASHRDTSAYTHPIGLWHDELELRGQTIQMRIVAQFDDVKAAEYAERRHIERLERIGFPLLNLNKPMSFFRFVSVYVDTRKEDILRRHGMTVQMLFDYALNREIGETAAEELRPPKPLSGNNYYKRADS